MERIAFDDIAVSTKTFTASTNLQIDLRLLFDALPVTPYAAPTRKRGRKKRKDETEDQTELPQGSIITLKYENKLRGVDLKSSKPKEKQKWFRNSFTVVIVLDKHINFKICRNGTFQMTGCKRDEHARLCVSYIWSYIKDRTDVYSFTRGNKIEALFVPAMRNIDFTLGFLVDREKLARYMSTQTEFHCLLETSFGYTGVNIKIPLTNDITDMNITRMHIEEELLVVEELPYQAYLDVLSPKDRQSKLTTERYNTFLVFHSGKVIMSGITDDLMRNTYSTFLDIIAKCHRQIEEKLEPA